MGTTKPKAGSKETESKENALSSTNQLGMIGLSSKFAVINKLITRDLNNNTISPTFSLYSKDDITRYIANPYRFEKELRKAVTYIYGASTHFRRIIQYFTSLSDLSYIVSPYQIDPRTVNQKSIARNYRKVLNTLSSMNIKTQFPKILTVCLREDTYYGTMWVTNGSIIIQQLPSDFCQISSIENNVLNVSFDFSYFGGKEYLLDFYPQEFRIKYESIYRLNPSKSRWIELDSPTSFAIKCNNDILDYAMPPFAGLLREVYDIEDYKQLKMGRTALENYAMLVMTLPMDDEGNWLLDHDKAKEFWSNLDSVLPEEVGSVLSPMDVKKISFEKSNTGDTNTVADAEQNLWSAAGTSSLLFNNAKASANALALSIKVDQAMTFGIVKSLEDMVNRYVQYQAFGKNFKVTFLDVSMFNRKEMGDAYLKAASYGIPTISMYAASQGLGQAELDSMSFLENKILGLTEMFKPLRNSSQMSASEVTNNGDTDNQGGRPLSEGTDLTDSGEQSREDSSDWG